MFSSSVARSTIIVKQTGFGLFIKSSPLSILLVLFASYMQILPQAVAAPTIADVPDAATPGGAFPREILDFGPIPNTTGFLEIPKVIDRPLDIDEGERVKVTEFILKGVQNREEYGIREEDVAIIAEGNRIKRQRLDEEDTGGFTDEEITGVSEFIRRLVEEPNQRPTSSELWKLVFKLRNSEWNRGLTIGQIQEVADEITRYYRQHGLILATAFIPAQDVTGGKVIIEVLEGKLGDIQIKSNQLYSEKILLRPFQTLKGEVVHKDRVESSLLYLSDYPGLNVSGIFQPGKGHGDSDLLIKVLDERRIEASIQADNAGSKYTGIYKFRGNLAVNNLFGFADRLNLTVNQATNDAGQTAKNSVPNSENEGDGADGKYGAISYTIPLVRNDWLGGVNVAQNAFTVRKEGEGSIRDVKGESLVFGGHIKKQFFRNRAYNFYALADATRKRSKVRLTTLGSADVDEYDIVKLELGFDNIDTRFAGINVGVIQLHQGIGGKLGAGGFADSLGAFNYEGGFQKININFSRLQTLFRNSSLLLSTHYQYALQRLHSLERFALGGANSVRAYPISEYLTDAGYFASLEWIINAPGFADKIAFTGRRWGELFNISIFYDIGGGEIYNSDGNLENVADLQGAGIAMKFNIPGKFSAKIQAAKIVGATMPFDEEPSERYYFDLIYHF